MSSNKGTRFYKRTDFKITLWYVLTFTVTTLVICGFMYLRLRHHLIKEIDRFLTDEAREFTYKISTTPMDFQRVIEEYEGDIGGREYYPIYFRVVNADGRGIVTSRNFSDIVYPIHKPAKARGHGGGQ